MTDDELLDAMQRDLGYRTESLRLARERATTPGERDLLDEVEAQIRADARRFTAAAARAAEARRCGRCRRPLQIVREMRLPCACLSDSPLLEVPEARPVPTVFLADDLESPPALRTARFRRVEYRNGLRGARWFKWEEVATD